MTAAGNTSMERTFCRNHDLRVVLTLTQFGLERPCEVPFLLQLFFGHAKKS